MINFRKKYSFPNEEEGKTLLGHAYWNGSKKRNNHRIVNKHRQKYKIYRVILKISMAM